MADVPKLPDWYRQRLEAEHPDTKFWSVAKGNKVTKVYLFDEIGFWGTTAKGFLRDIKDITSEEIHLHINSPGGEVWDAVAIVNSLRDHPARVTAIVDGIAASAASIVAVGTDKVIMARGSQMMIHDPMGIVIGNAAEMREYADLADKQGDNLAAMYAEKAGGEVSEWRDLMRAETWYTAQEAVDAGLADELDAASNIEEAASAVAKHSGTLVALYNNYKTTPVEPGQNPTDEEEAIMPATKALVDLATRLGVPEAEKLTDDAAVYEAIDKVAEGKEFTAKADDPEPDGTEGAEGNKPSTGSMKLPAGVVAIDKTVLDSLIANGKQTEKVVKKWADKERDDTIERAIADGKIPRARKDHWTTMWDNDPEGTKETLAKTPKNLVPMSPVGHGMPDDDGMDDYRDLYPEGM